MASHNPRIYLLHMRDCCDRLAECAGLRGEEAVPARVLFDAVCRNLEVLGEASRKLVWAIVDREIPRLRARLPGLLSTDEDR